MKTNDPHLTKTPLSTDTDRSPNSATVAPDTHDQVLNDEPSVVSDSVSSAKIDAETTVNKGTETFEDKVVDTEHVKDGDIPARQPDRRDQEGSTAFDEGVNEDTTAHKDKHHPKSDEITDYNRYATVDNAQSRVLNTTDQKEDGKLIDSE